MECNQCGNDMSRQTKVAQATPDAEHVFWCSKCGALARVSSEKTSCGRSRTTWLLPVESSGTAKNDLVNSATSDLASIIGVRCDFAADEIAALLKRVVDERLREIFGDIDAPAG